MAVGEVPPPCPAPVADDIVLESKDRDGNVVSIDAKLLRPAGEGPFGGLVFLHGAGGAQPGYLCIAARFVEWGYVTMVVDSNSAASRNREYSLGSFLTIEQAQDAYAALRFLRDQVYTAADRIGLVGWSNGGTATLAAVSDVRAWPSGALYAVEGEEAFAAAVARYPACPQKLKSLRSPLLVLIGTADDRHPAHLCKEMSVERGRDDALEVIVYPGSLHGFDGPWSGWTRRANAADNARARIQEWFFNHMHP
ncbi:MAG: prolyl oligopeptidase family serine peptidase [Pseudomonadota bacterium]